MIVILTDCDCGNQVSLVEDEASRVFWNGRLDWSIFYGECGCGTYHEMRVSGDDPDRFPLFATIPPVQSVKVGA